MNKYKPEVRKLSDLISERAPNEAECFPIDRYFLEEFLEEIEKVDKGQFLLYNLENLNNTYTVQLLLCLPELWILTSKYMRKLGTDDGINLPQ